MKKLLLILFITLFFTNLFAQSERSLKRQIKSKGQIPISKDLIGSDIYLNVLQLQLDKIIEIELQVKEDIEVSKKKCSKKGLSFEKSTKEFNKCVISHWGNDTGLFDAINEIKADNTKISAHVQMEKYISSQNKKKEFDINQSSLGGVTTLQEGIDSSIAPFISGTYAYNHYSDQAKQTEKIVEKFYDRNENGDLLLDKGEVSKQVLKLAVTAGVAYYGTKTIMKHINKSKVTKIQPTKKKFVYCTVSMNPYGYGRTGIAVCPK